MIGSLRAIALALGGEVAGGQALAPGPGHSRADRSMCVKLSPTAPDGFVVFSYSGDDFGACRDYVRERLGLTRERRERHRLAPSSPVPRAPSDARREAFVREQIAAIMRELVPVRGTPGETYLREIRRIDVGAIADVLERTDAISWRPAVLFREDGHPLDRRRLGAIVAIMSDPVTAKPTGAISRTYLHEGRKVGKAKTFGAPQGIVRLTPDTETLEGLHLAEGLETALAAMSKGLRPIWATGSTALMAKFPVLSGIECLTLIVDHDQNGAGERAARTAGECWAEAGREVRIICPKTVGDDFNDIVKKAGK